ncbi:hypothetical protein ACIGXM_14635 [Kitasatospora sp. NPDC052896]|uniref:hypothetical protein n=1 Tax=Kitasatospora sp. NPDC052896 TaxID=3364061 RepID=UPI0037CC88D0
MDNQMKLAVVCAVGWRPKLGNGAFGDVQVEEMQLLVERHADEVGDDPYTNRYYDLWREAMETISGRHGTHRNFFQIEKIEPICSCLGPCRYAERTRFWVKPDGAGFFPAGLFDHDREFERDGTRLNEPAAAGSAEDMTLLLEHHRRTNHHR